MTFEEILESSPAKRRMYILLQEFPLTIREYIMNKYSGFFNYMGEINDADIDKLSEKLESALAKQHIHFMNIYGDIL